MPYDGTSTVSKNLKKMTEGETLWLWRRSLELTQAEAGAVLKVSEKRYNMWETDREEPQRTVVCNPTKGDLCALARRRDGRPLRRLAETLGAGSHVSLLAWERTSDPRLVAAWRRLGYRF
jgi:transcriptional regulator with XRE-family HTH domain